MSLSCIASVHPKRSHLVVLAVSVVAASAVPAYAQEASSTPSSNLVEDENPVPVDQRPLTVADAYHGVGFMFCLGDARLVTVADAYHGVGVAVCV